jgi:hypothetical protein
MLPGDEAPPAPKAKEPSSAQASQGDPTGTMLDYLLGDGA